jgi:hypothetical protein
MATDTFVNILDLQPITEVVNGDYLIVETPVGTRIINFKDFILPNSNILLSQTVFDNSTAILSNFNVTNDYIASLSSTVSEIIDTNNTSLNSVSSLLRNQIQELSSKVYYGSGSITINAGANNGTGALSPITTKTLVSQNISITPSNEYAARNPAYITNIQTNNIITISSPFSGAGTATENAVYNLLAITTA